MILTKNSISIRVTYDHKHAYTVKDTTEYPEEKLPQDGATPKEVDEMVKSIPSVISDLISIKRSKTQKGEDVDGIE